MSHDQTPPGPPPPAQQPPARRVSTATILAAVALVVAIVALVFVVVTSCSPDDDETTMPTATKSEGPTTEPTPTPTTEPTAEPTPTPTTDPEPELTVLSADGIGDIPMGTVDPLPALVALFGPPDGDGVPQATECGPGDVASVHWGRLIVNFDTSTGSNVLWGWDLTMSSPLPSGITTASGLWFGDPLSDAMALPGATAPEYWESMDVTAVTADGVNYYGNGSAPAVAMITRINVNGITCD
jgi:hypothetical protein